MPGWGDGRHIDPLDPRGLQQQAKLRPHLVSWRELCDAWDAQQFRVRMILAARSYQTGMS